MSLVTSKSHVNKRSHGLSEAISYLQEPQKDNVMKVLRKLVSQGGQIELPLPQILARFMLWHPHQAFLGASRGLASDA